MQIVFLLVLVCLSQQDEKCLITQKGPTKPKPSLKRCYRNNNLACCNSAYDTNVESIFGSLFPSNNCQNDFEALEQYMCFGCNKQQPQNTDSTKKVIKICKQLADKIYGSNMKQYDQCGMLSISNTPVKEFKSKVLYLPSMEIKTQEQFFQVFKPSSFESYSVEIVADNNNCFKKGNIVSLSILGFMILMINYNL